jgi:hypothetical protein
VSKSGATNVALPSNVHVRLRRHAGFIEIHDPMSFDVTVIRVFCYPEYLTGSVM